MSVIIGSARISEKGTINGVKGDSTGNEVGFQEWYLHPKGWVCIRAKDATVREKIAESVESTCSNNNIGYGQSDRDTSLTEAKKYGYDTSKITNKCNTDCSMTVLIAVRYAGIHLSYDSMHPFYTGNIKARLKTTGAFEILEDDAHCSISNSLKRGDILVTKTKGHVVTVLQGASVESKYKPQTWYSDENGWWYAKDENNYAKSEWQNINHHSYYFNAEGYAVTGLQTIDGKQYMFATKELNKEYECALMGIVEV